MLILPFFSAVYYCIFHLLPNLLVLFYSLLILILIPVFIDICVKKVNELSRHQIIWTDEDGFLLKPLGINSFCLTCLHSLDS